VVLSWVGRNRDPEPASAGGTGWRHEVAFTPGRVAGEALALTFAFPYAEAMNVELTSDQQAFARRAIESGRFRTEEEAVREALALWEERERRRAEFLLTLDDAKACLARGEGREITQESMRALAQEVKERGRARLLAELSPR